MNNEWTVAKDNLLYKCGWSPMKGTIFHTKVEQTFINGNLVYDNGEFNEQVKGREITFGK